jgi:chloramphenicol 3-O phosphotransferase
MPGSVILLNGASSSGKSTLARATQARLPVPFWHYSIDHLIRAEVLPQGRIDSGEFPWSGLRKSFFEGFHRSISAIVEAGNNLLVEHIIETREWMDRLIRLLSGYDVFTVGLHCPLPELERREAARGNRRIGEARADFQIAHLYCEYDLQLNGTDDPTALATRLVTAWSSRCSGGAMALMAARLNETAAIKTRDIS